MCVSHPVYLLQQQLGTVLAEVLWENGWPLALWCGAQLGAQEEPLLGLRRQDQPEARRPGDPSDPVRNTGPSTTREAF